MNKLPPIEKVYEAWSAIADGRVQLDGADKAQVTSSDRSKVYTIKHDLATDTYYSNDNATFWRGYAGYPILAVMMVRGQLPVDMEYIKQWANVNWKSINDAHKRDYASAVRQIETERGINSTESREKAEAVMETLKALPIHVKRLMGA